MFPDLTAELRSGRMSLFWVNGDLPFTNTNFYPAVTLANDLPNIHSSEGYPVFKKTKITGKSILASWSCSKMMLSFMSPWKASESPASYRKWAAPRYMELANGATGTSLSRSAPPTVAAATAHQENHPHRHRRLTTTSANRNPWKLTA